MTIDEHRVRVYSGTTELQPIADAGTITADRGWSPHVQGRLTVRTPANPTLTSKGTRITLELTQRFADIAFSRDFTERFAGDLTSDLTAAFAGDLTSDITATFGPWNVPARPSTARELTLVVTNRSRSRGTHTIDLESVDTLVNEWLWYDVAGDVGMPVTLSAATTSELLQSIIAAHAAETTWFTDDPSALLAAPQIIDYSTPASITPTTHTFQTGEGTIARLQQFLTEHRKRLYSPGDNTVRLVDYPYNPGGEIVIEEGSNLIDWEINEPLDPVTMVRFTGKPSDPAARPIYSSAAFPELVRPHGELIEADSYPVLVSGLVSGITAAVEPYMRRIGLDESPVRLVTINDYSVMPGSPISYTLPGEGEVNDTIDAMSWQLGGRWEMNIWL